MRAAGGPLARTRGLPSVPLAVTLCSRSGWPAARRRRRLRPLDETEVTVRNDLDDEDYEYINVNAHSVFPHFRGLGSCWRWIAQRGIRPSVPEKTSSCNRVIVLCRPRQGQCSPDIWGQAR